MQRTGPEIVAEHISRMPADELQELACILKDMYGIDITVSVSAGSGPLRYEVSIIGGGTDMLKKIALIKEIRQYSGLGLREAKDVADTTPWPYMLKSSVTIQEARQIQAALMSVGAEVGVQKIRR